MTGTNFVQLVQNDLEPGRPSFRTRTFAFCPSSFYYGRSLAKFREDFFKWNLRSKLSKRDMSGAQGGGKGKGAGIAGSKVKGSSSASRNRTTDIRPVAAVQTDTSVPPPPPGSPLHAASSMTLASMSLNAPTTPVLTSGTAAEVQDLTGSVSV